MRPVTGSKLTVSGSSRATPVADPSPGNRPMTVPNATPTKHHSRFSGERAVEKPRSTSWNIRIQTAPSAAESAAARTPSQHTGHGELSVLGSGSVTTDHGLARFASTLLALALVPVLGALTSFGLLIFGLLAGIERERWWLSAVISIGVMYVQPESSHPMLDHRGYSITKGSA